MNEHLAAELAALWTKIRVLEIQARETRSGELIGEIFPAVRQIQYDVEALVTRWRCRFNKLERKS